MLLETQAVRDYLLIVQENLCLAFEELDGYGKFVRDYWDRPQGGNGLTCAMSEGAVIEKAGINFSHAYGEQLPVAATQKRPELSGMPFVVVGLSLIIHPRNPYAPTTHFNLRFFQSKQADDTVVWWFGGGFDLTPYYGFLEDCIHWHQIAKNACDPFGETLYPRFKQWADEYFYLKHRQEHRGIGGLFFDDLQLQDFSTSFDFIRSIGDHFSLAYLPLLTRRKDHPYTEKQRDFQCYRRGRYAEFNLIYDRGTLFGLQWGGRVESILISLPPKVSWSYNFHPASGTEEARLYEEFLAPKDWLGATVQSFLKTSGA